MTSAYNIATEKGHINLKLIICFFYFSQTPPNTHTHTHTHTQKIKMAKQDVHIIYLATSQLYIEAIVEWTPLLKQATVVAGEGASLPLQARGC